MYPRPAVIGFPEDPSLYQVMPKRAENHSVHNPVPADWHQQTHSAGQYQDMPTDRLAEWLVSTHVAVSAPTQTILVKNTLTGDISRNSTALMVQTLGTCIDQHSQVQTSPISCHLVKRQRQRNFHSVTLPNIKKPIFYIYNNKHTCPHIQYVYPNMEVPHSKNNLQWSKTKLTGDNKTNQASQVDRAQAWAQVKHMWECVGGST